MTTIIDHADAWDLAHMRCENSNLARCYIELRQAAQAAVDTYYVASGKVVIDGQDGYNPLRKLRLICESNRDSSSPTVAPETKR